jgi:NAD(P)-dependent dehydrogenase (short-subunit alcohol dehydrogenase family)
MTFESFQSGLNIAVIGASGGIGNALIQACVADPKTAHIFALSRQGKDHPSKKVTPLPFDFTQESSLLTAADRLKESGAMDIVIVATGLLQDNDISPEKNMRALNSESFAKSLHINTIGPAMCAKSFLPLLRRDRKAVFAVLSARVGSISDNRLGGWYAYRASKAALNMVIKTLSIEHSRRFKDSIIVGLHPGTVDTDLSKPFQSNVPEGKLFTPEYSAGKLLSVIDRLTPQDSGDVFDWAGEKIPA